MQPVRFTEMMRMYKATYNLQLMTALLHINWGIMVYYRKMSSLLMVKKNKLEELVYQYR